MIKYEGGKKFFFPGEKEKKKKNFIAPTVGTFT